MSRIHTVKKQKVLAQQGRKEYKTFKYPDQLIRWAQN